MASRKRKREADKDLDHEDSITLLNAVVAFKHRNGGATPSRSSMKPFYDSVKDSLHRHLDFNQMADRIYWLKRSYRCSLHSGAGPTSFDRAFFDLSRKAWGTLEPLKDKSKNNIDKFETLGEEVRRYWEKEKLGAGILEMGLRFVDELKAEELEERWRSLLHEELEVTAKSFELKSEICEALNDDTEEDEACRGNGHNGCALCNEKSYGCPWFMECLQL